MISAAAVPLDPDLGWHLRTGETILATHQIPHVDTYSYTAHGAPWVEQEWLWQAIAAWINEHAGAAGLALATSLVVGAGLALVYATLRLRNSGPVFASGAVMIAMFNLAPAVGVRPALTAFVFSAAFAFVLEAYRRRRDWRLLMWLIPLQLLWANTHASYILGPVLCAAFGLACAWELYGPRGLVQGFGRRALGRWALLCISLLTASVVNPNRANLLRFSLDASRLQFNRQHVAEWLAPNFQSAASAPFFVTLVVFVLLVTLSPSRRPGTYERLLMIGGTVAFLQSREFAPIYAAVSAPVLAQMVEPALARFMPKRLSLVSGLCLTLIVAGYAVFSAGEFSESRYSAELTRAYPAAAVGFIQREHLAGPMWNEYDWGGYLIQNLPGIPVFIDGRSELYGDSFLAQYVEVEEGRVSPTPAFDVYGIKLVLIPPHSALATELRQMAGWRNAYEDHVSVIFTQTD